MAATIIAIGYSSYRRYVRNFEHEIYDELTSIAELKTEQLAQWRKERLADASYLDENVFISVLVERSLRAPADRESRRRLETWLEKFRDNGNYDEIHLLDRQGRVNLTVPAGSGPVSRAVIRRLPDVIQSGRPEIVDFYMDDAEGRPFLSLLIPVFSEGVRPVVAGVLALRLDPRVYLYPYINRWPSSSRTAETLLVRRDGDDVLFLNELRFQKNAALNLRIPLREQTIAGQAVGGREGIVRGFDYRRKPVIANLRRIPDSPWFLVTRIDVDEVYAPVRARFLWNLGLIGALLMAAGLGIGTIQRRQKIRFLREGLETARSLHAVSTRQEALIASLPEIIMEVDQNKVYVWANQPGLDFFGDDVIGKEAAFYFEGEQDTYKKVTPVFNGSEDVIYVESWQRRRDGRKRLLGWWCRTLKDPSGNVTGALSSARDITERKQAEDRTKAALEALRVSLREKEFLLQEIHHRVKNNMQIISSLFNLEAEHASPETREILKRGQTRIRSLSLVHERLLRAADLSRIDLSEYIQDLAVHLFQVYLVDPSQVRLETDFEKVSLDINSAIPCGLILNELISNALKHAFPDGRKGVVRIRLARAPGNSVELQVFDDGVGLPEGIDLRNPASFGFEIISLLVGQLEAEISLERKGGTTFILKFKELKYKPRI